MAAHNPAAVDAFRRIAPRPLALHLSLAMATWSGAVAAAPLIAQSARDRRPTPWHPTLTDRGGTIADTLSQTDPAALLGAVGDQAARRFTDLLAGIEAYRNHPYRRRLRDPQPAWSDGAVRLLDFGSRRERTGDSAIPMVFVPSLVNKSYILDLAPKRSLVRAMAGAGLHPYLLDWGVPGVAETGFGLADYVRARLIPALVAVAECHGRAPAVVGYCMGGLLALAGAARRPDLVGSLALLATPWDFHHDNRAVAEAARDHGPALIEQYAGAGAIPIDVLQIFFALIQPLAVATKFRAFAKLAADGPAARRFVQIEDWLNDGVPLATGVARDCLLDWYADNRPHRAAWAIDGAVVDPSRLTLPCLAVIPRRDRIVPAGGALPLVAALPSCQVIMADTGHVSMVVGRRARTVLWQPLADWLRRH